MAAFARLAANSQDKKLRYDAIAGLGRIGGSDPVAVKGLTRILKQDSEAVFRQAAVEGLGQLEMSDEVAKTLATGLKDTDSNVRVAAAKVLARLNPMHDAALRRSLSLPRELSSPKNKGDLFGGRATERATRRRIPVATSNLHRDSKPCPANAQRCLIPVVELGGGKSRRLVQPTVDFICENVRFHPRSAPSVREFETIEFSETAFRILYGAPKEKAVSVAAGDSLSTLGPQIGSTKLRRTKWALLHEVEMTDAPCTSGVTSAVDATNRMRRNI